MNYKFDAQGWYRGVAEHVSRCTTTLTPPNEIEVGHLPCWQGNCWDVHPYTPTASEIAAAKEAKVVEIVTAVDAANRGTFTHLGRVFSFAPDKAVQIQIIQGYVTEHRAFPPNFPGAWKDVNREIFAMPNITTFLDFYSSMTAKGLTNFMAGEYLQALVAQATTLEQIAAINVQI